MDEVWQIKCKDWTPTFVGTYLPIVQFFEHTQKESEKRTS